MSNPIIIDRRKNPDKKSLSNRQRFLDRFRDKIKDAAKKHINKRDLTDTGGQGISIPIDGIEEPTFHHGKDNGQWDYVVPGNKDYMAGDKIPRPKGGQGGAGGKEGGTGMEGEDDFQFLLSYDEYIDLIFDDLELPDLVKKSQKTIEQHQMRRAGYTTAGVPSNLNIEKTAITGLSRRIALKLPKLKEIKELEEQLEKETDEEKKAQILEQISELRRRANAVMFLDNSDLRYNNFVPTPRPVTKAVMFCVMDVSYSMGEEEKTIAKKFFLLLHLFLKRNYKHIDVVFVRHHEKAKECNEEEFFKSKETGGTIVSSAYHVVNDIIKERYNPSDWNIYMAQASDGDNYRDDSVPLGEILRELMPITQFLAYIEIKTTSYDFMHYANTYLWDCILSVSREYNQIEMQQIYKESDVISIFRNFFSKTKS